MRICDVLVQAGACNSLSEARRLAKQGGITYNGEKVLETESPWLDQDGLFKIGKDKWHRVTRGPRVPHCESNQKYWYAIEVIPADSDWLYKLPAEKAFPMYFVEAPALLKGKVTFPKTLGLFLSQVELDEYRGKDKLIITMFNHPVKWNGKEIEGVEKTKGEIRAPWNEYPFITRSIVSEHIILPNST